MQKSGLQNPGTVVRYACTNHNYIMSVLNQVQKLVAEDKVPLEQMNEVSELLIELANLKEAIEEVETRFNSAKTMTQRHRVLRHWTDLETQQTDLAIDLAEMLNLSDETLRNLIK